MRGVAILGFVTLAWFTQPALAAPDTPAEVREVLPSTLVPAHYELMLVPDAEALRFKGRVQITGNVLSRSNKIVLNAKGLVFDEVRLDGGRAGTVALDDKLGRAAITFAAPVAPGQHTLSIAYHGPITKATVGFFAMDYNSPSGKQRTLATNFEPAEARRLLPCWDEPASKATFTLTVDLPIGQLAFSNMPVAATTSLGNGLQRVRFSETPKMSTYLLFLGIGDFERVHRAVDGVDVGVVVKRGDIPKAAYALGQAVSLLHYYNTYFGVRFPLPKLDLIAAPGEITGGSMENWGAIFYSQDHLLFDPKSSTEDERQLVFLVVAHEMSHQWFGDLVTMAWWDNLWLNEGFARWMQTHAADALHPEWQTGLQAANIFENGKRADAKISTHPVLQPILSAEQAAEAFDNITYDKGAAVITMLEAYVGADKFRDGVRRYMRAHAFGNTVDGDLWREVQIVAGKPVLDIERDFTRQPGVPLVRVEVSGSGSRITEGRFAEDPATLKGKSETLWRMPLAISVPGQPTMTTLLTHTLSVTGAAPLVNAGGLAYGRVAYVPVDAEALARRMPGLSAMDQINLMNDAWALAQSGYAPAGNLMEFMARIPAEANPIVWSRAVDLLLAIDHAYGGDPDRADFRQEALKLLAPVAARLGLSGLPTEGPNLATLRSNIWIVQARFSDSHALTRARVIFGGAPASITDQRTALDIVGQAADLETFNDLLARARATNDPQQKTRILRAMALAADPALSARMVEIIFGPDAPSGTVPELLSIAAGQNPDAVWQALQPRMSKGPLPIDPMERWGVLPRIAAGSAQEGRIADVRRYGEKDMPADARRPIEAAVASIQLNQRVKTSTLPDINRWIATHRT
jgi:aminopeptidase N